MSLLWSQFSSCKSFWFCVVFFCFSIVLSEPTLFFIPRFFPLLAPGTREMEEPGNEVVANPNFCAHRYDRDQKCGYFRKSFLLQCRNYTAFHMDQLTYRACLPSPHEQEIFCLPFASFSSLLPFLLFLFHCEQREAWLLPPALFLTHPSPPLAVNSPPSPPGRTIRHESAVEISYPAACQSKMAPILGSVPHILRYSFRFQIRL